MRKSLWIMLAAMVVAIGPPSAHADSFTYTYTDTTNGLSWTTAAIPAVTMETTLPATDLTATSNTGSLAGCVTKSVTLDVSGAGGTFTDFITGTGCVAFVFSPDGFALADYSTPGTYPAPGNSAATLVVTAAVAAPEPSSVALMLLGVGLAFVMRKRNSRGHQLAA